MQLSKTKTLFKAINAWKNVMLFSASLHIVILLILAIRDGQSEHLNYLSILNLPALWPQFFSNSNHFGLASGLLLMVYAVFLFREFNIRATSATNT